jgi:hypothetical protein
MSVSDKVWFCTETRLGRAIVSLIYFLAQVVGVFLAFFVIYQVEMRWFPVVSAFQITDIKKLSPTVAVSGTYVKARPCELLITNVIGISAGGPALLLHQVRPADDGANLPTGKARWGPYTFSKPADWADTTHIQVVGVHRCHALWSQQTTYASFPVEQFK